VTDADRAGQVTRLHHVAFAHDEDTAVPGGLADLRGRGVRLAGQAPQFGGGGSRIAFIHPAAAHGLLIELVEPPSGEN
jgi:methylmalonyl-CoA/ethylmalonyl-CoA epimerase